MEAFYPTLKTRKKIFSVQTKIKFCKIPVVVLLLSFYCALAGPIWAIVKPPVHVTLTTGWKAQKKGPPIQIAEKNQEITITTVIISGVDSKIANYELTLPSGWELISGRKTWQGPLVKNQTIALKIKVRVISDSFGIIKGKLLLPGFGTSIEAMLDLRNPEDSDRIPEWGRSRKIP